MVSIQISLLKIKNLFVSFSTADFTNPEISEARCGWDGGELGRKSGEDP
jgi:hypothetical protein